MIMENILFENKKKILLVELSKSKSTDLPQTRKWYQGVIDRGEGDGQNAKATTYPR